MHKSIFAPLLTAFLLFPAMIGCASTQVQRMDVGEVKDISGRWNDTDSRLVAEEMIKDCLSRPWLAAATSKKGNMPTVIVGTVRNQSSEHIATDTFTEDLQRELINSGKVEFVASKGERGDVRDERLTRTPTHPRTPARSTARRPAPTSCSAASSPPSRTRRAARRWSSTRPTSSCST